MDNSAQWKLINRIVMETEVNYCMSVDTRKAKMQVVNTNNAFLIPF